jgi:membrane-associated phospholipid phosphatase
MRVSSPKGSAEVTLSRGLPPPSHSRDRAARALLSLGVIALILAASSAQAQSDEHRLEWSSDWARVHPASYAVTGAMGGFSLMFDGFYEGGAEAQLRGPTVIDQPVRDALMAPTDEGREMAGLVSDILLGVMIGWPLIDALVVAGLGDLNSDVAWQLTWIAAESYALEMLINTLFKQLVARERPHGSRCTLEDRLENPARCGPGGRLRSFYSGHSSFSFSAAGQVCVNHAHLPLYGSDAADAFACGAALLVASTVATLRMIADRHYVTDVLVGAVLGLSTGFLMPYLLHYQWDPGEAPEATMTAAPLRAPLTVGFRGTF